MNILKLTFSILIGFFLVTTCIMPKESILGMLAAIGALLVINKIEKFLKL